MSIKAGRVGVNKNEVNSKTGKLKNGGGGGSYVLPVATPSTLGGVKPVAKTEAMTQEIGVDSEGRLYTTPGGSVFLSGTTEPDSQTGEDGDIYLRYIDYDSPPEGYQYLKSLSVGSTGGPYLSTGFTLTQKSEFELDFRYTDTPTGNSWLFGAYVSGKQTNVGFTDNRIYMQTGGVNVSLAMDTVRHVFKSTQNAFVIDGDSIASPTPAWSNTVESLAHLFYILDGNASINCEIYGCKIWDDGALVRNLIPVIRSSDSAKGMYDLVNSVFYGNIGTGSFSGDVISGKIITNAYFKNGNVWQNLIGTDINDL